jgi:hypothetical protein
MAINDPRYSIWRADLRYHRSEPEPNPLSNSGLDNPRFTADDRSQNGRNRFLIDLGIPGGTMLGIYEEVAEPEVAKTQLWAI